MKLTLAVLLSGVAASEATTYLTSSNALVNKLFLSVPAVGYPVAFTEGWQSSKQCFAGSEMYARRTAVKEHNVNTAEACNQICLSRANKPWLWPQLLADAGGLVGDNAGCCAYDSRFKSCEIFPPTSQLWGTTNRRGRPKNNRNKSSRRMNLATQPPTQQPTQQPTNQPTPSAVCPVRCELKEIEGKRTKDQPNSRRYMDSLIHSQIDEQDFRIKVIHDVSDINTATSYKQHRCYKSGEKCKCECTGARYGPRSGMLFSDLSGEYQTAAYNPYKNHPDVTHDLAHFWEDVAASPHEYATSNVHDRSNQVELHN